MTKKKKKRNVGKSYFACISSLVAVHFTPQNFVTNYFRRTIMNFINYLKEGNYVRGFEL